MGAQAKGGDVGVGCIGCHGDRRGKEDRKVRYPADRHAQAEAQTRAEGRKKSNVREGGEGRGKASNESSQSFRRQSSQGLCLSDLRMVTALRNSINRRSGKTGSGRALLRWVHVCAHL